MSARIVAMICLILMGWGTALAQPSWRRIGNISEARFLFRSYQISQSECLMVGGSSRGIAVLGASATCDILDVDKRTIVPGPRMNVPHAGYASVQMPDSSIIVIGGITSQQLRATDVIERFDPVRRTWTIIGHTREQRMHMAAIVLDQDRILISGGRMGISLNVVPWCDIFDLRTGTMTPIADLPVSMADGAMVRTKTGQILAFGGRDGGAGSSRYSTVYRLDTTSMRWRVTGDFPTPMLVGAVLTLADGDLMVAGGTYVETDDASDRNRISDGIFKWSGNAFDSIGRMEYPRTLHSAVQYDDSTLLIVGGKIPPLTATSTCEWIDVRTGRTASGPEMSLARSFISLIGIERNGKMRVFAIGGMVPPNDVATTVVEELSMSCNPDIGTTFGDGDVRTAGSARSGSDGVVLTESESFSAGSVWSRSQVDVTGGFTVSFSFRMTDGNNNEQPDGSLPGADGIAFVVQNSGPTALGKSGEHIGYGGIPKALAVEFDTYLNPAYSDPNGNHIAVQSGGLGQCRPEHMPPYNLGITTDIVTMIPDGSIYHGRISYQGNRLNIYLDTTGRFERPALVLDSVDIPTLLGLGPAGAAWIGFTSATGKSVERHELLSWDIDGCAGLITSINDDVTGHDAAHLGRTFIAPMPSHGAARLFSTAISGAKATIVLYDATGALLGTMTTDAYELVNGVDLPFHPPTGTYYIRIVDGMRSITLPWAVIR